MNAMLPGRDPLQQHMKWAADQRKAFLDRQRDQAGYEEWKRRRQGKKARGTLGAPPLPLPPPPPPPWSGASRATPAPMPAPRPRGAEVHHPVRAFLTFVVMLALTFVVMMMASEMVDALVALVVVGGVGLVVTVLATRSVWRDR